MFQVGDIVNIKELYNKISWYYHDVFVIKHIKGDYLLLSNKITEFYLWDEYVELNPINIRKQKIQKIKNILFDKSK